MKYQIAIRNAGRGNTYERDAKTYTSKKKAQAAADQINSVQPSRQAVVVKSSI